MNQIGEALRSLCGRVVGCRQIGKVKFYDVMRDHCITQLTTLSDANICRGDFIRAKGVQCLTRNGAMGIKGDEVEIICKFKGTHFPDRKMGYNSADSQREIDLLANPDSHETFRTRSKVISKLRSVLEQKSFLEVETPILSGNANGAIARPFKTRCSSDGGGGGGGEDELYLRIAPELYLKRLIIGGFDRVFEIGKVFRNEGEDSTHNPEFTSLELYQSFATFKEDLIPLVKEIFSMFSEHADLSIRQQINILDALDSFGIKIDFYGNIPEQLEHHCKVHNVFEPNASTTKLFDKLVKHLVEPSCDVPTILTHFPLFTSPLAAASKEHPLIADRLEVFVNRKEVANGYQELTDPVEQEARFRQQLADRQAGDQESPLPDSNYIESLRLGLAPTIGLGIGIDRLVMLLTNSRSIKNVIFFNQTKVLLK